MTFRTDEDDSTTVECRGAAMETEIYSVVKRDGKDASQHVRAYEVSVAVR
ncbi:MAG TPA: hypothetical protein VGP84_12080 [Gemmatimonadaceae bacterium]|nr:hypothetical protein [Gemmatimonadaceae bacterium]